MTLILVAFALIGIPESVGDLVLYQHGASLYALDYWDVACWAAIALVYRSLREMTDGRKTGREER